MAIDDFIRVILLGLSLDGPTSSPPLKFPEYLGKDPRGDDYRGEIRREIANLYYPPNSSRDRNNTSRYDFEGYREVLGNIPYFLNLLKGA
jgi:hypothetical protein